jgi:hypothetical protein
MYLWIALVLSVVYALLKPFVDRLNDTSLWAGKVLSPPELAVSEPRGLQAPLTAGWPSNMIFCTSLILITAIVCAVMHAWWCGALIYACSVVLTVAFKQMPIASPYIERYLMILHSHALRRSANYAKKGDNERADAAKDLANEIAQLQRLYLGTFVPAPTRKQALNAAFGEPGSLLRC